MKLLLFCVMLQVADLQLTSAKSLVYCQAQPALRVWFRTHRESIRERHPCLQGSQLLTARTGIIVDHSPVSTSTYRCEFARVRVQAAACECARARAWLLSAYPAVIRPNSRCDWSIKPFKAGAIVLYIYELFRTEKDFDTVRVYDRRPNDPSATLLGTWYPPIAAKYECMDVVRIIALCAIPFFFSASTHKARCAPRHQEQ